MDSFWERLPEGYHRLGFLISGLSAVITYIILSINENRVSAFEALIEFPFYSALIGIGALVLIRGIRWVQQWFAVTGDLNQPTI